MEIGRFEIVAILGAGAHGVVALARDFADASSELVAVKVLNRPLGDDVELRGRLRDEARILAWLSHPNIVQVHRLLEKEERPVVVMEYVPGASVQELREAVGPLPLDVSVAIAREIATALRAAHEAPGPDGRPLRLIHRDVKPGNVLLSVDGQVKILDFGIAAADFADREAWDRVGEVWGTAGYVAPERRAGRDDVSAVDVYSLGMTLLEMATGRSPAADGIPPARGWPTRAAHDRWLAGRLDSVAEPVRAMIQALCSFEADERPPLHGLPECLIGDADLVGFAQRFVTPLHARQVKDPPRGHGMWLEVSFLQEGGPIHDLAVERTSPPRPLALRQTAGPVDVEPLLAVLRHAAWWSFWTGPRDPAEIAAALVALRGTRDARVISRAHELTHDPDPRVSEAAWELLDAAC